MTPPNIRELDFSEFHPLDHTPGSRYCRELPGGTRNHLSLAWQFKWSMNLAAATRCRIGRHHKSEWWDRHRDKPEFRCWDCGKKLDHE
jgi:hypothetical protein